jgi:hypothetical protein
MARLRSLTVPPPLPSSRRRLAVPRHRSTTANVCAIYPGAVQAPLPAVGPLLGVDLTAGDGPLCWDPFEVYDHGLVTNPNVFVMGEPGFSKSSLIKCWAVWQHCLYGANRWLTITDPKGEYRPLADRLGMTTVRLAPGGTTRINPLESAGGIAGDDLQRERAVQSTMLYSLAATQLARPLRPLERKVLRAIVAVLLEHRRTAAPPTLLDVLELLAAPTDELCTATVRSPGELIRDVEDVRYGLDELCTGHLRGMFDGPSNVQVDWASAGLVIDLNGVVDDPRAMALVMVAAPYPQDPVGGGRDNPAAIRCNRALIHVRARQPAATAQDANSWPRGTVRVVGRPLAYRESRGGSARCRDRGANWLGACRVQAVRAEATD